jgi:hypothetical protein
VEEEEEPCLPRTIWKHTVAPAGPARELKANPHKMEHFNRLMVGELVGRRQASKVQGRSSSASASAQRTRRQPWFIYPPPAPPRRVASIAATSSD